MSITKWEEVRIKDLGKVITGKTPPTVEEKYFNGEYLFISPKDMSFESRYINKSLTSITYESIKKFKNQVIPRNSIMYTSLSYGFGKIGIASTSCLTNQQINTVVVDEEKYDFNFVYYLLRNSKDYFLTFNAGIVTPIISKSTFEKIKIKVVKDLNIQKKIAKKLSNYDDLIENNQKQIELLEKKARLTYEEWFLQFRIDGKKLDIDKDSGLPFGWETKSLSSIGEYLNGYAFKPEDLSDKGYPIVKIKEMKNGIVSDTPRNCGKDIDKKYIINHGDILFSWSASLEVIQWKYEKGLLNQHLFLVTPKKGVPKSLLYLSLLYSLNIFDSLTTGATMKHIRRKELDFVKVVIPMKDILNKFDKLVNPILNQILIVSNQNQKLKEARDILLPRLMSGMIEV